MNEKRLTDGGILATLLQFAVPVFAALFLQAMYGAVDLLVVGKFAHVTEQSGVATGSMFMAVLGSVITGFALGVTVLVAEAIGCRDEKRAGKGIGVGITLFGIIAVILTVLLMVFAKNIAVMMHAPENAMAQTMGYIRICGAGSIFIVTYNVIGAVFRGIGDSKTPLLTVAIACIVNIVADLLLVIVFQMGAKGAALATVFAQAVSVVISLILIRRRKLPFRLERTDIRLTPTYAKKIMMIGTPVALQELLVGFSFIFIQSTVNAMGVVESAGIGVGEKVCAFLMLVASAYMQSMAAFVAQNNAAGKQERSKKALKYGIETALAAGAAMGALAFFGGSMLAAVFSNDAQVIAAAHSYLKAYAIDCLLTAALFCFMGYFNGCERTMFVMIQGIVGAFCVRVPLVYLFGKIGNGSLFLIGLATPASSVIQIFLCVIAFLFFEKRAKQS
ncbi:MAG: MATE family efflux transporter [Clostridia bacterium]|nr:MATE family efflux transporter [Clostridia bacterium]